MTPQIGFDTLSKHEAASLFPKNNISRWSQAAAAVREGKTIRLRLPVGSYVNVERTKLYMHFKTIGLKARVVHRDNKLYAFPGTKTRA